MKTLHKITNIAVIMRKIRKDYNVKIVAVIVAVIFLFNSTAYGINLFRNRHLRIPLDFNSSKTAERRHRCMDIAFYIQGNIMQMRKHRKLRKDFPRILEQQLTTVLIRVSDISYTVDEKNNIWIWHRLDPDNTYVKICTTGKKAGQFGHSLKDRADFASAWVRHKGFQVVTFESDLFGHKKDEIGLSHTGVQRSPMQDVDLKIGMFQLNISPYSILKEEDINTISSKIKQYMEKIEEVLVKNTSRPDKLQKPDLMLFSEGLSGFDMCLKERKSKDIKIIDAIFRDKLKPIIEIAKRENMAIGLGALLKNKPDKFFGSYLIIMPNGKIINNIRGNCKHEERTFEINGNKIGLSICYDYWFMIDKFKNAGVDIVMAPLGTNLVKELRLQAAKSKLKTVFINDANPETGGGSTWWLGDGSKEIFLDNREGFALIGLNREKNIPSYKGTYLPGFKQKESGFSL
jgi:hypothetical protein